MTANSVVPDFRALAPRHAAQGYKPISHAKFFGDACYSTYEHEGVHPRDFTVSQPVTTNFTPFVTVLPPGVYPATLYTETPAVLIVSCHTHQSLRVMQLDDRMAIIQTMVDWNMAKVGRFSRQLFHILGVLPESYRDLDLSLAHVEPSNKPSSPIGLEELMPLAMACADQALVMAIKKGEDAPSGVHKAMNSSSSWMARRIVSSMASIASMAPQPPCDGWVPEPPSGPPSGTPYKDVPAQVPTPDYKVLAYGALEWLETGRVGGVKVSAVVLMKTLRQELGVSRD
jgi:hypothetical protein